ncbi:MAG: hypothetical protein HXY40_02565 [Chloroflexi bacterium]|nr:hypothetical protein [Chloroflexota bacterium]
MIAIDKHLVKQLESHDIRKRRQAVDVLNETSDPIALKLLLTVARQDPDSSMRALALMYAEKRNPEWAETVLRVGARPLVLNPAARAARKRALDITEAALTLYEADQPEDALKTLARALAVYPDIEQNPYFLSVACEITQEEEDAGALAVVSRQERGKSFFENLFGR